MQRKPDDLFTGRSHIHTKGVKQPGYNKTIKESGDNKSPDAQRKDGTIMYNDKNDMQGLQGFDSAVPTDGHTDPEAKEAAPAADNNREQGYTVTPVGGYYSGRPDTAETAAPETAADDAEAPKEEAPAAEESKASSEYHYSSAAGNIPFAGSEDGGTAGGAADTTGQQDAGSGASWQSQNGGSWQQGQQAGGNSYIPPSYGGFVPNGNYGYQNPYSYNQPVRPAKPPKAPKAPKQKKEKKSSGFPVKAFVACILAAAVVGAGAGAGGFAISNYLTADSSDTAGTSSQSSTAGQTISIEGQVENLVQAVAEKVGPSVVGIRTTAAAYSIFGGQTESTGEGSGVIYTEDGYIITNYHVIQAAAEQSGSQSARVDVYLPSDTDTAIPATIVGYNITLDLAVLKIDQTGLPAAEIGNSDDLSVGQYAVAIGSPGGLEFMGSVTYGVISGLNRKITTETSEQLNLIQTDAAINPGNSGGALVNSDGQVIGINSVKLVSTGYESMGFAIPINTVVATCDDIISRENEPTPYLGLEISTTYDAQTLQMLGYPTGAVVNSVTDGSPADDAGIQRGDIITEFAGTTISSYTTLSTALSQCSPGQQVDVTVYRGGRYYSATVTLGTNSGQVTTE